MDDLFATILLTILHVSTSPSRADIVQELLSPHTWFIVAAGLLLGLGLMPFVRDYTFSVSRVIYLGSSIFFCGIISVSVFWVLFFGFTLRIPTYILSTLEYYPDGLWTALAYGALGVFWVIASVILAEDVVRAPQNRARARPLPVVSPEQLKWIAARQKPTKRRRSAIVAPHNVKPVPAHFALARKEATIAEKDRIIRGLEMTLESSHVTEASAQEEELKSKAFVQELLARITQLESLVKTEDSAATRDQGMQNVAALEAEVATLKGELTEANAAIDEKDRAVADLIEGIKEEAEKWETQYDENQRARSDVDSLRRLIIVRDAEIGGLRWELYQKSEKAQRLAKWKRADKGVPKIIVTSPSDELFFSPEQYPEHVNLAKFYSEGSWKECILPQLNAAHRSPSRTSRSPQPCSTSATTADTPTIESDSLATELTIRVPTPLKRPASSCLPVLVRVATKKEAATQ